MEDPFFLAQNLPSKGLEGFSGSDGRGEYVHGIMENSANQPTIKGQPNMYGRDLGTGASKAQNAKKK